MTADIRFGLTTFGDVYQTHGSDSPHSEVICNIVKEAQIAEEVGVDNFSIGEHHRRDFAVSAPELILANIAGITKRIHIGTAATVLPTDNPIRLYQRHATLQALSGRRAELTLGRGWFSEPYKLFNIDKNDADKLFELKLDRLINIINKNNSLCSHYTKQDDSMWLNPITFIDTANLWIAVGSTPNSALRAARKNLPMMLSIIGGPPARAKPLIDIYRLAFQKLEKSPQKVGIHCNGYVANSDADAIEIFWRYYKPYRDRIGSEKQWPPLEKKHFMNEVVTGSLYVGSAETVAKKIASTIILLGVERFDLKYSCGHAPHDLLIECISLFGSKVVPMVREMIG